ncbi:MAG: hypothetical protein R3A52_04005 [Polyangiales bacterium]
MRELVWTNQRYSGDAVLEVDRLVVRAGASVRVLGYLQVRADELVIEGPAVVDGRGARGAAPVLPVWTSNGGDANLCLIAHRDWSLACEDARDQAGSLGNPGSIVVMRARRVVGELRDLSVDVAGGPGGPASELRCGCVHHTTERCSGPDGPAGPDGTWTFVQE